MSITNNSNMSLPMAVMALYDDYDHNPDPHTISVTSLLKPIRATVLTKRCEGSKDIDVMDLIPSVRGTALHNHFEKAWIHGYRQSLEKLGYPEKEIDKIKINPELVDADQYSIFLEKRSKKEINGWTISGKFDFVMNNTIHDIKTTSVWGYIYDSNSDDYIKQMSIYKWLNPEIITKDIGYIEYEFTDWSAKDARGNKSYPQKRVMQKAYPLLSNIDTEKFIVSKLSEIDKYMAGQLSELPRCTKEELWQKDTVFKYYKNPENTKRATKNFTSNAEATDRLIKDGNIGVVIVVKGEVKRCKYCNARPMCMQAEELKLNGLLSD